MEGRERAGGAPSGPALQQTPGEGGPAPHRLAMEMPRETGPVVTSVWPIEAWTRVLGVKRISELGAEARGQV